MMRTLLKPRRLHVSIACVISIIALSLPAVAQVSLSAHIGFENQVMPGRYAPLQVDIRGFRNMEPATIRVSQTAGNAWRGEATLQQVLDFSIQSDGRYDAVIPVYDPANAIQIDLVARNGSIIGSTTLTLRDSFRPMPFPVLDRQIPRFNDQAAVIEMASLPSQWWALDSVQSLWIASPLSGEIWKTVSQWLTAGGSLVLLTGTDFYRMDSPILRQLLPIENPTLSESEGGTVYLSGELRDPTAEIQMLSEEGFPLLITGNHGAGRVSLVTVRASSFTADTFQSLEDAITPANLISLYEPTESLLASTRMVTLNSFYILGLGAVMLVAVCGCALIGRGYRRVGYGISIGVFVVLAVWSGLVSNPATRTVDLYLLNTHVHLLDTYGISIGSSRLFSQTALPVSFGHEVGAIPVQVLPRSIKGMDSFDCTVTPSHTEVTVQPGRMRDWRAMAAAASILEAKLVSPSAVWIDSRQAFAYSCAWLIVDGMVYALPTLAPGAREYAFDLGQGARLGLFLGSNPTADEAPLILIMRKLDETLSLRQGVWIVAIADVEEFLVGEITAKVRDITVVTARGEGVGDAI